MTINSFLPGINHISITSGNTNESNTKIKLKQNEVTFINLSFTLTGLNKLIDPFNQKRPFYIYIFLAYQDGGRNFEIISSSQYYCDEESLQNEEVKFVTTLEIPRDWSNSFEDFIAHFYNLNIVYSEDEAQDGSDINSLYFHPANSLLHTKLNIS